MVADAADRQQMASVIEATAERFGAIHGVIHAAGIVRAGLMQAKTKEVMESVLAPKVYGTAILFDLLREAQFDVDFLVLFSSITSVITPYAESDYSAANAFLDAFTYFANAHGPLHALTINWPGWREVGQLADLKPQRGLEGWKEAALSRAIATDDGLRAFERALTSNLRQVIVNPTSLDSLLEESREPFDVSTYLSPVQVGDGDVERPTGQENHKDAPTDEVEMALTEVWQSALGIERIGVHDRFSDLGGHSLLAMQIVSRIRSVYQIGCTMREFFEAPTIAELARWIKQRIMAEIEALSDDEAGQLVSTPKRGVGG